MNLFFAEPQGSVVHLIMFPSPPFIGIWLSNFMNCREPVSRENSQKKNEGCDLILLIFLPRAGDFGQKFIYSTHVLGYPTPQLTIVPRGGTPLYGLNGDVRPNRVWFSEDFVLNGVLISSILVLNRVSLQDLMYSLTTEPSQKAKFLPVCQCSAY